MLSRINTPEDFYPSLESSFVNVAYDVTDRGWDMHRLNLCELYLNYDDSASFYCWYCQESLHGKRQITSVYSVHAFRLYEQHCRVQMHISQYIGKNRRARFACHFKICIFRRQTCLKKCRKWRENCKIYVENLYKVTCDVQVL